MNPPISGRAAPHRPSFDHLQVNDSTDRSNCEKSEKMSTSDFTIFNMDTAAVEALCKSVETDSPNISHPIQRATVYCDNSNDLFKLRKARYFGETKWIKVIKCSTPPSEYYDFLAAAKEAFGISESNDLVLRDEDDALIEPSLFSLFPDTVFRLTPKIDFVEPPHSHSVSTADTVSISSSLMSGVSNLTESPNPCKKARYESLDLLAEIKSSPGGNEILKEYAANAGLTAQGRRKLVNLVVNLMVTKFGFHPSKENKIAYAKEIVKIFPRLKDPGTAEGYEIFYDPLGRAGYISWRLRTLNRRRRDSTPLSHSSESKENVNDNTLINVHPSHNPEVAQAQLIFMRNACPKTQKTEILQALQDTFTLRRSSPDKILEDFPRFLDAPYLIEADFRLIYPTVKITNFSADVILRAYEKYSVNSADKSANKSTIEDDEPDWDKVTRGYITLLKLLPPTAKGRKKVERVSCLSAIDRIILFHKTGTPLENVEVKTKQPCLLAVGPNKGAISSYFIAVEGKTLPIEATDSAAAFDTLFKCHFVLNTKFDHNLNMYYTFIQAFFYKMEKDVLFTARMREVRTWLSNVA